MNWKNFIGLGLILVLGAKLAFAFSDISYQISCKFNPEKDSFVCTEKVTFTSEHLLNEIHFHFYPNHNWSKKDIKDYKRYAEYFSVHDPFLGNFDPNWAQVNEVRVNSQSALWEFRGRDETILVLKPNSPLSGKIEVDLNFEFYVPRRMGRFGRYNGIYSLYRFYPILDVYQDGKFLDYPDLLLHQPYISEMADYDVNFIVPDGLIMAGSLPSKVEDLDNGWKRWHFYGNYPLRDFYVAMSKKYKVYSDKWNGKDILVYYLGKRKRSAREIAQFVKSGLEFYSRNIAQYPYDQVSVIPIGLGYGGNETGGAVMLDWRVYDLPFILKRYKEFLVVHELGHQWWYNQVGSDEYKETWMDEGINSYWVQRYFDYRYGPNPKVLVLPGVLKYLFPNFTFRDSGIYKWRYLTLRGKKISVLGEIGKFKEPSLIFAVAYGKGERILEILEKQFGRDQFEAFFKDYFSSYKGKIARLSDFEALLRTHFGEKAIDVLEFYLSPKVVNLTWRVKGRQLCIISSGYDESIGPIEVRVKYRDGKVKDLRLDVPNLCLPVDKVMEAKIDPEDSILEEREDDNIYSLWRGVDKKMNLINHLLYDLPVVNVNPTVRTGFYANKYGAGVRVSYTNPSTETKVWFAPLWGLDGESRSYCFDLEYPSLGHSFWNMGLSYIYDDIYERDILHRKILAYLAYPLAPPSNNPLSLREELKFYLAHEYQENANPGVYYPESDLAYAGVSVNKRISDVQINVGIEKGIHWLDGDVDFLRAWGYGTWRKTLGQVELGMRAGVGVSDENSVEMFYLGGRDNMRAFSRYELPGKGEVYFGAELGLPVWQRDVEEERFGWIDVEKASLLGFIDLGQVWQDDYSPSDTDEYSDAGTGLEFWISVGSNLSMLRVRVEWAKSLKDDKQSRVGISVNSSF